MKHELAALCVPVSEQESAIERDLHPTPPADCSGERGLGKLEGCNELAVHPSSRQDLYLSGGAMVLTNYPSG